MKNITSYFTKDKSIKNKFISIELCTKRNINIELLDHLSPPFCSITWMDSNLSNSCTHPSISLARQLQNDKRNILLHLPGRNLSLENAKIVLNLVKSIGVKNIFALQGDKSLSVGMDASKCDFPHAIDLIRFIKTHFADYFSICVAGYPTGHPDSKNLNEDIQYLKDKVDSGADFIITQAVFDIETFRNFRNRCKIMKIDVPILPGVYVVNSYDALFSMIKYCKLHVPDEIMSFIYENRNNYEVIRSYGISMAVDLIRELLSDDDIFGIHIFSLNDLYLLDQVFNRLTELNVTVNKRE